MLAAVLHHSGPPDAFVLSDVPRPDIQTGDDVLVRVRACGVSYRDIVERNGTYRRDVSFPLIIGLEISGTVEAVGADVVDLKPGDHVCSKAFSSCGDCRYCRTGRESTCARRQPVRGGYAEYVVLRADALTRVPDHVPFESSCSLGPAAGVALNAVRDTARVTIGDVVLVTGATGGVGLPAVSLAKRAGGRVLALTRNAAKRQALLDAGADEVLVSPDLDDFADQVRATTGGEGADVVIDTVGSAVFDGAFDSLARHGRYAVVGQLDGEKVSINLARIFFKRAQLLGVGSVSRAQLADVVDLVARGELHPVLARSLPLRDVAEAHRLVEQAAVAGRVILIP
ncbi:MAG: zinc-binding dehydrogenase family oxidoreductase [Bradyrhizobium sp.]|nr:zinc-binding dehydrogenase family oxidoreductase [Bradyrhizobium sp.]